MRKSKSVSAGQGHKQPVGSVVSDFQRDRDACLQMCDYVHPSVFFGELARTNPKDLSKHVKNVLTTSATFEFRRRNGLADTSDDDEADVEENTENLPALARTGAEEGQTGMSSICDLKQKLHAKIEQLRSARKHKIDEHNQKVKEVSASKKSVKGKVKDTAEAAAAKKKKVAPEKANQATEKAGTKPSGEKSLSGLLTSRIETLDDAALLEKQRRRIAKRIERHKLVGKDYSKLLQRIERLDASLKKLAERDPKRAERVAERRRLATAIDRAAGLKIRDDPELIRKSIKSRDARKRRSRDAWRARTEEVTKRKNDRQQSRRDNIDKRKQTKQKQKLERARKKGRFVISKS